MSFTVTGATFSPDRRYRYLLWRNWDQKKKTCLFVMLNPSTADEFNNDPTVERCERRATEWGYGRLLVCNIFALRSTDPKVLYSAPDPVGAENDVQIALAAKGSKLVVCGWGAHGSLQQRGSRVLANLRALGVKPHALRVNADGSPGHPLYIPYSALPEVMLP